MRIELDPDSPHNSATLSAPNFIRERIASRLEALAGYYLADAQRHTAAPARDALDTLSIEARALAGFVRYRR